METKAKPLSWCRSCSLKVKVSGMRGGESPTQMRAATGWEEMSIQARPFHGTQRQGYGESIALVDLF